MNRFEGALGIATVIAAITFAAEKEASACGGCFTPPSQNVSDITDERMLLAVSTVQSTLYDQIQYSGSPSNFAWVLPIHGTVTVGLSADVLFDSIDVLTETEIFPPPVSCPSPNCFANAGLALGGASSSGDAGSTAAPVQVLVSQNVGPYATVQLHSTDGSALNNWLLQNGYNIPAATQPILAAYVQEGFDFLAMKLLPNQGVQSMRPVRVSTPGASLSLPLRMASIGTGAITGITIWVVADGRYEPQNFPFFHIDDSQLVWDFATSSSNYTTLRTQEEAVLKNAGWEIESSIDVNEQIITNVIESGGQYSGNGLAGGAVSDPSIDYLPVGSPDAGTDGGYESAEQVRDEDVSTLFVGMTGPNVRITRIRSDIAQTAMNQDLVLEASTDQSELSNVHNLTQSVNLTCPIYDGCSVVGQGTPAQAAASIGDGGGAASAGYGNSGIAGDDGGAGPTLTTQGGGCTTSAPRDVDPRIGLSALAGMIGLAVGRAIRARRRGSKR
jgi:hypothetical protein